MSSQLQQAAGAARATHGRLAGWSALLGATLLYAIPRPLTGPLAAGDSLRQLWELPARQVMPALATGAPYLGVALVAGLFGLLVLRQIKRRGMERSALQDATGAALRKLAWKDFERLLRHGFRRRGYRIVRGEGSSPVDLEVTKDGERYLVEAKHWQDWQVGVEAVQAILELIPGYAVDGAFVVSCGEFTHAAERFAQGTKIELIDLHRLRAMVSGRPEYHLAPRRSRGPLVVRLALAAMAAAGVGALAMTTPVRWPTIASAPAPATESAPAQVFGTIAKAEAREETPEAFRSGTPLLPAEIRMDFPRPGQVRAARPSRRVAAPESDAERERRAEALNAEFEAEYQPPADCDNWRSMEHMVACGNHRIRAWKAFQAAHWSLKRIDTVRAGHRSGWMTGEE
jgi:HJR/Mrr/RecB family endonuclease